MPDVALLEWAREAVRALGTQKEAAEATGIPYATLQRVLSGASPLTADRVERIAGAAGLSAKEVLAMKGALVGLVDADQIASLAGAISSPSQSSSNDLGRMSFVPWHDVVVSAGHGASAIESGETPDRLGFPTGWVRSQFGDPSKLRIVHVKGDSMAPTLGDGDLVMIDIDRRDPVDGIFVLRLHDQLLVKRVHFPSARRVIITSDNREYDRFDRMIDLEGEAARTDLQIIGRVVWAGRSM